MLLPTIPTVDMRHPKHGQAIVDFCRCLATAGWRLTTSERLALSTQRLRCRFISSNSDQWLLRPCVRLSRRQRLRHCLPKNATTEVTTNLGRELPGRLTVCAHAQSINLAIRTECAVCADKSGAARSTQKANEVQRSFNTQSAPSFCRGPANQRQSYATSYAKPPCNFNNMLHAVLIKIQNANARVVLLEL